MVSFWNNINPTSVNFNLQHKSTNYAQPPLDTPNPNWQLPPGFRPSLPAPAVPAPGGNLKRLISNLPSIFNISHG